MLLFLIVIKFKFYFNIYLNFRSHIRDICIQEDTFLCISTREHKYSPKEKPSIDTSELNNFSDTCNRNNFQYDPNDTTNSEDIVILE